MIHQDPFRLRILKAITELLKTITVANGYKTDLAESVFRGRAVFGAGDPIPMVSILEAVKIVDGLPVQFDGEEQVNIWPLLIQGWVDDELGGNPTDSAHILLADVKQALTQHKVENARGYNFLGMEGKVVSMDYNAGVVRPTEEVSGKSCFWLILDLELVEDVSNPYA